MYWRTHRIPLLLFVLVSVLLAPLPLLASRTSLAQSTPVSQWQGDTDPILYEAILPEHRERIYELTAGRLSRYRIDLSVTPDPDDGPASIAGTVDLRYVNETVGPVSEIYFRLYPNGPAYSGASMTVSNVTVAGEPVEVSLSVDDTVLAVPLGTELAVGDAIDVALEYTAIAPNRPTQTYGIFAVDPATGAISLAHAFPILAGYDESGWSLEPVSRNGDPVFSNTALFDVSIMTPDGWVVAATGRELEAGSNDGATTRRFVSGPARDFTAATSDRYQSVSRSMNGVTITSYFFPEHEVGGEAVLEYAARALSVYESLLTPYPYRQLVLVETELFGAGGVEFVQFVFMGTNLYDDNNRRNEHYLEFVTAHEVGHQWFYGLVGNNQHQDAFIDEGLDEYLSTEVYFSEQYDDAVGRRQFGLEVLMWYLGTLRSRGDLVVDRPTDDFSSSATYGAAIYAKGAIGFAEIRALMGDEAFFSALRNYATEFEFKVATPDDLLAAFEAATDKDVAAVWETWFQREQGEEFFDDNAYDELQVELGLR